MQRGHYQALLPDFVPMIEPTLNYVPCPGPAAASAPATHADVAAAQHRMAYWEWNATGNPAHPHVVVCVHGLVGSAQKSAYVAAKHGIVGLTKVTALETATTGITANAICPGWVLTPLVQKQVDAKAAAHGLTNEEATKLLLGEKEPSMQFTTPDELGELAVFFCSTAANNVRGVAWNMDGGWAAQ